MPRAVEVRLAAAARELRNAEAVLALARFLARFHTAPAVLGRAFPVDRTALAAVDTLGLTEARVRGALAALETVGFLIREAMPGSAYRPTTAGLRRKPVIWRIAPDFVALFERANAAAQRDRGAGKTDRRPIAPPPAPRPSPAPVAQPTGHRKAQVARREQPSGSLLIGEQNPASPETGLEAALDRLRAAVERGTA